MAKRLSKNLTSRYLEAAHRLQSKQARRKIFAYVESYDDVLFWSQLLREVETDEYCFEVMLPSRNSLTKGKRSALTNVLGEQLGRNMIACVDADYDYLMQGATASSRTVTGNPYVFHTYVYAIENYQCYAPSLRNVCVMATLNDHRVFDFEEFLSSFSVIVWPLFVWSIWCYRHGCHNTFSMASLCSVISISNLNVNHPEVVLEQLRRRVSRKIGWLQHHLPQAKRDYAALREELERLGVTPETTYLYIRGHDLVNAVVIPMLATVCETLRREREHEIRRLADHKLQMQNELAAYQHATAPFEEMLRKHTGFRTAPPYLRVQADVRRLLDTLAHKPHSEYEKDTTGRLSDTPLQRTGETLLPDA